MTRHPELVSGPIAPFARPLVIESLLARFPLNQLSTEQMAKWALKRVQGDDGARLARC